MKNIFILLLITSFIINIKAQENKPAKATYTGKSTSMRIVPPLSSRVALIPAEKLTREPKDGRSLKNKIIIGKDPQTENDFLASNPHPLAQKTSTKSVNFTFEVDNSVGPPSDPALAVGPNHVMIVYNTGFSIYDKSGTEIQGPLAVTNIFSAGGCCDLTISYDNAADRWVMTFLYVDDGIEVAVSDGPDPETASWFVYSIPQVNDYNKLSVWSDGYYITDNTGSLNKIYALERAEMLAGNPAAQIIAFPLPGITTSGFYSPQALNVTDSNSPAAGGATFVYLQDDAWAGVAQDHIKLWTLDVDWVTPGNSTISAAQIINTTPFISVFDGGSFSNLAQPGGGSIDALQATIMNQAQFRKFENHNSAVFNFVVDTDASSGELAGVRWFELRQDDDNMPWSLHQEGTYTAPDGRHAWHASMAMDAAGNIGMGYTSMSGPTTPTVVRVSSYYTGRFVDDPLGTMNVAEELIANGTGNVSGNRYGDYSKIDVDPSDNSTFWFINEYINGSGKDIVGVFSLELLANDIGVTSIDAPIDGATSATEQVTITIHNFGDSPQSNIPVSFIFNGNTVNETFTGTIATGTSAQYTFTATVNMSTGEVYSIESCTNLVDDEKTSNNCSNIMLNQLVVCIPVAGDGDISASANGCNLDGIKRFVLGTIDVDNGDSGCNNEGEVTIKGYADRRHLSTDLNLQEDAYILQSQMNWEDGINGPEKLSVWIDFNDNGTFETSEQLIFGEEYSAFNELVDFNLTLPASANLGSHVLRVRSIDTSSPPGDINDPCADYAFGETQDYTVNIIDQVASVDDNLFNETNFIVSTLANNQFNINVTTTEITEKLNFSVTNMLGQKLLSYSLYNVNGGYNYDLNMSYATPGVYILRLGNSKYGNTKKIVIK
ncbi:MAG: GEVED domain-containing protein [Flavobacteriaceae bacterium]|nr:GEVED domain-containing protein [Flavobacteriaceae bacterium]